MSRSLDDGLRWAQLGTQLCDRALAALDDSALAGPSALPGWSRAHVVAHLDGNARALSNLVTWATTGVETPMYSSMEQRNADIASGAALPAPELRARFADSASTLAQGLATIPDWEYEVRTAQGRLVPISEVPWMRSREVVVHAVDLLGGVAFDDIPDDFLVALAQDVAAKRSSDGTSPALLLLDPAGVEVATVRGDGELTTLTGSPQQITSYLTGREPSFGPTLPAWL
jgi:uncharacterized protein (TIGR03083 family)